MKHRSRKTIQNRYRKTVGLSRDPIVPNHSFVEALSPDKLPMWKVLADNVENITSWCMIEWSCLTELAGAQTLSLVDFDGRYHTIPIAVNWEIVREF